MPLATNTVVVGFEQLAANVRETAVDVILLDTTFWGGIRPCIKAAGVCETLGMQVAVHSSGELGIQLATMLHLGAVIPNLGYAADAHYHHLTDDVIAGGKMRYADGKIPVPDGEPLRNELQDFVDAVRFGRAPLVGGHDGRRAVALDWDQTAAAELWAQSRAAVERWLMPASRPC